MKKSLFAAFALVLLVNVAKAQAPNIDSTTATVKIGKTVEITKKGEPVFRDVVCNFAVTPGQSSPPSLILSGAVVSNNSGAAREFIPIFFGSSLHNPRLAALTDVAGAFRFRVWLSQKADDKLSHRLQAADIKESTLYLGGLFNGNAEMLTSEAHIYSLGEFFKKVPDGGADTPIVIPPVDSIGEVTLRRGDLENPRLLTVEEFKQLMRVAKPMTKAEYVLHAIPAGFWYQGAFNTPEGLYVFTLGLSGVNVLTPPTGPKGFFRFEENALPQEQ